MDEVNNKNQSLASTARQTQEQIGGTGKMIQNAQEYWWFIFYQLVIVWACEEQDKIERYTPQGISQGDKGLPHHVPKMTRAYSNCLHDNGIWNMIACEETK